MARRAWPQVNKSVTNINLYNNHVGNAGATSIADALKVRVWRVCVFVHVFSLLRAAFRARTPPFRYILTLQPLLKSPFFCLPGVLRFAG